MIAIEQKNNGKRLAVAIVAFAIVVCAIAVVAMPSEGATTWTVGSGTEDNFDTLSEALASDDVVAGDTIILNENQNITATDVYGLSISKAVTIDGNGMMITGTLYDQANYAKLITVSGVTGTFTLKNVTLNGPLNVWKSSDVDLVDVTINLVEDPANEGVYIPGLIIGTNSIVEATDLVITGEEVTTSTWGGNVNVDKVSTFKVNTISGIGSVYSENSGTSASTITVEDATLNVIQGDGTNVDDWVGYFDDVEDAVNFYNGVSDNSDAEFTIGVEGDVELATALELTDNTTVAVGSQASLTVVEGGSINGGTVDVSGTLDATSESVTSTIKATADADIGDLEADEVTYNALANYQAGTTISAPDNSWTFDGTTLTLNNYQGSSYFYMYGAMPNVVLTGNNIINITPESMDTELLYFAAIKNTTGNLSVSGTGSLTINLTVPEGSTGLADTYENNYGGIFTNGTIAVTDVEYITVNNSITSENGEAFDIMAGQANGTTSGETGTAGAVNVSNTTDNGTTTINADIVGSAVAVSNSVINGNITATSTFSATDSVINGDATAAGKVTLDGTTVSENGSITAKTDGIEFSGNVNIPAINGKFTVQQNATVIVQDVTIENYEDMTNNGVLIVEHSFAYNGSAQIMVYSGVPQQVANNQIYLYGNVTTTGNLFKVSVEDPVSGEIVNTVEDAEGYSSGSVTIVSVEPVDLTGMESKANVTYYVGTAYGDIENFVGTLVSNNLGYKVTPDGEDAIPYSVDLTVNGIGFSTVAGTGLQVVGNTDGKTVTFEGSEITGTITAGGDAVKVNNVSSGTDGITITSGSVIMSGTLVLGETEEGETSVDVVTSIVYENETKTFGSANSTYVLDNIEVTGAGTIAVGDLIIRGDVTIGKDVILLIDNGCTITVEEDAVLGGTGTVDVWEGGIITVYGEIESTVNMKVVSTTYVSTPAEFVSALEYYTTIYVDGQLDFTGNDWDGETVTVNEKSVILTTGGSITVGDGFTLDFVGGTVTTDNANSTFTVKNGATLGIDATDILMNVDVENYDEVTLNLANNVTNVDGAPTPLSGVGFGKVINFGMNYTIASNTELSVYGTVNVEEGYTLTIARDGGIVIEKSGQMSIAGTLAMAGTMEVIGEADVTGTLNVTGTLSGNVSNHGTITVGTTSVAAVSSGATVTMYAGASLTVNAVENMLTVTTGTDVTAPTNWNAVVTEKVTMTLTDAEGVTVVASETSVTDSPNKTITVTTALDIAGSVTDGAIAVTLADGDVTVQNTLDLADGVVMNLAANGYDADGNQKSYLVSGTLNVADGAEIRNSGIITVTGELNIVAPNVKGANGAISGNGTINAAYYYVSTAASGSTAAYVTKTYTTLAAAIDVAADVDDDTVYISGTVEVAEGTTVTVSADITVDNTAVSGSQIEVNGTLTFNDFKTSYDGAESAIVADVMITADPARTYTSLTNAIEMGMTDITLNREVTITDDLTIPADVTVTGGANTGIRIDAADAEKDITLTVEGALQLTGDNTYLKLVSNEAENDDAQVVVGGETGHIYVENNMVDGEVVKGPYTVYNDENIAGAHYEKEIRVDRADVTVHVISTIVFAADDSANVYVDPTDMTATITVTGEIAFDTLTFAAPEDATLTVQVQDVTNVYDSALRFNDVTLGENVILSAGDGTLTGAVIMRDADDNIASQVDLSRATGVSVYVHVETDPQTQAESDCMEIYGNVYYGTVTVSAGTVNVGETGFTVYNNVTDRYTGSLVVASGATLVVPDDVKLSSDNDSDLDSVGITIDGTLTVIGEATFMGAEINGTVTVTDGGVLNVNLATVNGTIDVVSQADYDNVMNIVNGILTVGAKPTILGTEAGTGTINGKIQIATDGIIKAYPGADLSSAQLNYDSLSGESYADSMVFNINGTAYMTVYSYNTEAPVYQILGLEEFELQGLDVGLNYHSIPDSEGNIRDTGLYLISNWYGSESMAANTALGYNTYADAYDAVYASAEPASVTGTISVGQGITLYVDGVPVDSGREIDLEVGTHTVRYDIQAGYNGDNVVMSFNGQTVQNDGSITVDVTDTTFTLSVSGAVPASSGSGDITVNVPSQDDDMSLTDILLIVLVILIVIMAIIVALRLMRS